MSLYRFFGKTPAQGAQTTIYNCIDENLKPKENAGHYFVDCKRQNVLNILIDERKQKMLWDVSKKLVKFE